MDRTAADKAALDHVAVVEPDFVHQNGEPMSEAQRHAWFAKVGGEMRANGAAHVRYSFDDEIAHAPLALVEGWKTVPANMGDPRWQLQAKD